MITEKHCRLLELDKVLERLSGYASCEESARLALAVRPVCDFPRAVREMNLTKDAFTLTVRYGYPVILRMKNCTEALRKAQIGSSMTLRELLDVANVLNTQRNLVMWRRQSEEESALDPLFESLYTNKSIEDRLHAAIISDEELDDNASAALSDIRRKIRSTGLKIRSQLDSMIKSAAYQKYLQDPIVTIRDGRFVVPVKAEYKQEVKGMVHDTSSSGATFFIEPMAVVEANNEVRVLEAREQQEIERIIAELSALVAERADEILSGYDAAITLDLYFAKSRLADRMRASVPTITDSGETVLKKARHPLLDPASAVAIDIAVGKDYDTLVITGPNTGGKTVAIKTLGLLTLMALCGLMAPCSDGSSISVYDEVLADIGDEQSIEQSLSTFSAHMKNIISIVGAAGRGSLVLLDELGAGTDPVEGAALGVSILETLRARGAKIAATTHYPEIKMFALDTPGVENASCEFDVATLRPTYRLLTGIPGRSNAFLISEKLGLELPIIERARELVSQENTRFEDVVSELEETRQKLEAQRESAQKAVLEANRKLDEAARERDQAQRIAAHEIERARQQAKRMVEEIRLRSEILYEELDEIKKRKDSEQFGKMLARSKQDYRANMKEIEELSDPIAPEQRETYQLPRPLKRGDAVLIRTLGKEGTVLSAPQGQSVLVQAGSIKTSAPVSDLVLVEKKKEPQKKVMKGVSYSGTSKVNREIKSELNLIGLDSEQAVMELDAFIDNAVMSGVNTIRIIHGKGAGILRNAVQQRLRKHSAIKTFRLGAYGEGENGVTIAELK